MTKYKSLTASLEAYFDHPTGKLANWLKKYPPKKSEKPPFSLRKRFDEAFYLVPWKSLSPNRRRSQAVQTDFRHDPECAARSERIFSLSNALMDEEKKSAPDQRRVRDLHEEITIADACLIREAADRWKLSPASRAFIAFGFLWNLKEKGTWDALLQAPTNSADPAGRVPQPTAQPRRPTDDAMRKWYSARIASWTGAPPTEKEDMAAAQQEIGAGVKRSQIRDVRKTAPEDWRKRGPRVQQK